MNSDFIVGNFMGGIFGGILISFGLGWMACSDLRRRGFMVIVGVVCLSVVGQSMAQQGPGETNSTRPAPLSIPLFGIAVGSPVGWQQLPPDRVGIATRWVSPGSRAGNVQGIIMVEMKKPALPDAGQIASSLAQEWGGRLVDKQDSLDGEMAWRILAEPHVSLQPVEGLLTIHEGRLYLIEGGVTAGHSCHDQIESIRQSWKWIPIDPPIKHLEFRDQPVNIFNNRVSINYPAAMYTFDSEHPERRLGFGLENFQLDHDEFTATVEFGELPKGTALVTAEASISRGIQARFNLPEAFVWHDVNGDASVQAAVTQAVPGPVSDRKNWIMWGIVGLPGNQIVLINFSIFAEDPDDRAIYVKTAEKMVGSVLAAPGGKGP